MSVSTSGIITLADIISRQPQDEIITVDGEDLNVTTEHIQNLSQNDAIVLDLRLGQEYFISRNKTISRFEHRFDTLNIEPGEFALLTTHEKLNMPTDLFAFISMKFTHSLKGLVNVSGFHVDPGYRGRIIFSVYNAGPNRIVLQHGQSVFMIIFTKLNTHVRQPQNKNFQDVEHIEPRHIESLSHGEPLSLHSLNKKIIKLETLKTLLIATLGIAGAIAITLIVTLWDTIRGGV